MNAQNYADDFARFARAGRIGEQAPSVVIAVDPAPVLPIGSAVRGRILTTNAGVRALTWRMRGDEAWNRAALRGNEFTIAGPHKAGTMELRCVAVGDADSEELTAGAIVVLSWPAPVFNVDLPCSVAERHTTLSAMVSLEWVEAVEEVLEDGSCNQHVLGGSEKSLEIQLPTHAMGRRYVLLKWRGRDGTEGAHSIEYEVKARPITLELRPLSTGGVLYRAANAEALELEIPGHGAPQQLPPEGVIHAALLMPISATLRYRDEAGTWRKQSLRLDHAPRAWTPVRGFRRH